MQGSPPQTPGRLSIPGEASPRSRATHWSSCAFSARLKFSSCLSKSWKSAHGSPQVEVLFYLEVSGRATPLDLWVYAVGSPCRITVAQSAVNRRDVGSRRPCGGPRWHRVRSGWRRTRRGTAGPGEHLHHVLVDVDRRSFLAGGEAVDQAIAVSAGQAGQGIEVDAEERPGVREGRGLELAEVPAGLGVGRAFQVSCDCNGRGAQDQCAVAELTA